MNKPQPYTPPDEVVLHPHHIYQDDADCLVNCPVAQAIGDAHKSDPQFAVEVHGEYVVFGRKDKSYKHTWLHVMKYKNSRELHNWITYFDNHHNKEEDQEWPEPKPITLVLNHENLTISVKDPTGIPNPEDYQGGRH